MVDTETVMRYLSHFWKKIAIRVETLRRRVLGVAPPPSDPHTAERSEIDRRLPGDGYNGDESDLRATVLAKQRGGHLATVLAESVSRRQR